MKFLETPTEIPRGKLPPRRLTFIGKTLTKIGHNNRERRVIAHYRRAAIAAREKADELGDSAFAIDERGTEFYNAGHNFLMVGDVISAIGCFENARSDLEAYAARGEEAALEIIVHFYAELSGAYRKCARDEEAAEMLAIARTKAEALHQIFGLNVTIYDSGAVMSLGKTETH